MSERKDPQDLTDPHHSKVPPDHPGLKLEKPRARTLKKGPALAVAFSVVGVILISFVFAFAPAAQERDPSKDVVGEEVAAAAEKNFPIPEEIRTGDDVPSAGAHTSTGPVLGPRVPKLGRPLPGNLGSAMVATEQPPGAAVYAPTPPDPVVQARIDELAKARAAGLFFEVEGTSSEARPSAAAPAPSAAAEALAAALASRGGQLAGAPGAAPGTGTSDPNLQDRKNQFLARGAQSAGADYLDQGVAFPRSPYELKAGAIIPAVLLTGINSDLPGLIVGQVRENVFDTVTGSHLLIPQGSRLIASYDSMAAFGQERVLVCWNRLVRPDGSSINLECMPGVDLAGYAGFADQVDHHWWRVLSGVALGSLLAATAQASQGNVTGLQPTLPQLWASGAASSLNQAGQQLTQKNLQIQPTITVRPGFSVNVLVSKDIVLPPYKHVK
jgi:type IV secretion system protein VirB10